MVIGILIEEFAVTCKEIRKSLRPKETCEIVPPRRLYLTKKGRWEVRSCGGAGSYTLVRPRLEELLTEFVYATCGLEVNPKNIREDPQGKASILNRFLDYLVQAQGKLKNANKAA